MSNESWKRARCTCGAVHLEVRIDVQNGTRRCNCTYCTKRGWWSAAVPIDAIRIVSGEEVVETGSDNPYWQGRTCRTCHTTLYGFVSAEEAGGPRNIVNVRLLEDVSLDGVPIVWLDGKNDTWKPLGSTIHSDPAFLRTSG